MIVLQKVLRRDAVRGFSPLALISAPLLAFLACPSGQVIEHFHVSAQVAGAAITAVVGGGWGVAVMFPWIIPAEVTILGVISVMGTTAAIAW